MFRSTKRNRPARPDGFYTRDLLCSPFVTVGEFTYGQPQVREWGEGSRLIIGKFCSVAGNVQILLGGNHRIDWITTYPFPALSEHWPNAKEIVGHPSSKGDVVIGNDVWIGSGATIMSGVSVGDGAVIGAQSLVSENVEPYTIVVGNPARMARKRFSPSQIEALLRIQWWNWPPEKIARHLPLLCSNKIDELIHAED